MTKKLIAGLSAFALFAASMVVVGRAYAQTDNSGASQGTDQSQNQGTGQSVNPSNQQGGSGYAVPVVPVPNGTNSQGSGSTGNGNTVIVPVPVNGGTNPYGMSLGNLFIYDQLFRGNQSSVTTNGNVGSSACPDGDEAACTSKSTSVSTTTSALPGVNVRSLGDLFVLGSLFGSNPLGGGYGYTSPYAYGGGYSGVYGGTNPINNNLGNLFVLDRLFGNGNSGILGNSTNGGSNLGDLYVLNALFNH
jgi:hypothetical protein